MENLKKPIKEFIQDFIKYKKSLGYEYNNTKQFYNLEKILLKNKICFQKQLNESLLNDSKFDNYKIELRELIKFNLILNNEINQNKIIIKKTRKSKYIPFIINSNLFCDICEYIDKSSIYETENYKYIYPVLYRLLYSTGMRINEAISLKISDLDISAGKININNSKNDKSRIIIISNSMRDVLKKYILLVKPQNYLFEYKKDKINYSTILCHLNKIRNQFNVHITFHDFRHSMATNSFKTLLSKGYNEKEILYYLHIYLGHASINETEYYFYFNNVIKDNMKVTYER